MLVPICLSEVVGVQVGFLEWANNRPPWPLPGQLVAAGSNIIVICLLLPTCGSSSSIGLWDSQASPNEFECICARCSPAA